MNNENSKIEINLSEEEKHCIENLTMVQKQNIDFSLMRYCTDKWQKVAMVVAKAMERNLDTCIKGRCKPNEGERNKIKHRRRKQ